MTQYINQQLIIINDIKEKIEYGNEEIKHISTLAFQVKKLKSEDKLQLKGEKVIYLTDEKIYNKFKTIKVQEIKKIIEKKDEGITYGMTNFEKWIYFIFKKDIR